MLVRLGNGLAVIAVGFVVVVALRPAELIRITLEFLKPFAATSTAEFSFEPQGNRTVVTWSMTGEVNFMAKAIHLFMDMDRMIGGNFERGWRT